MARPAVVVAVLALAIVSPPLSGALRDAEEITQEITQENSTYIYAKTGEGSKATTTFSFDAERPSQFGHNAVGMLKVHFPTGGSIKNGGFFQQRPGSPPPRPWPAGSVLGKADEYVWPIPPSPPGAAGPNTVAFVFDHGASDIVFGDVDARGPFRPEFNELLFGDSRSRFSPLDEMCMQLQEELTENALEIGTWMLDGWYQKLGGGQKFKYTPKLRLKNEDLKHVGMEVSTMVSAMLQRPSIMDIDNLFSANPLVPNFVRASREVEGDQGYASSACRGRGGGGYGGGGNGGGYGGGQGGYGGQGGGGQGGYGGGQGGYGGGQIGYGGGAYLQENETEQPNVRQSLAETRAGAQDTTTNLPIVISVQWLTPVLQKYRCVSVGSQYTKQGASPLFVGMGWDTESSLCPPTKEDCLDIDLSLVSVDSKKHPIKHKVVWYRAPAPDQLSCGGGVQGRGFGQQQVGSHHKGCQSNGGVCAMNAFSDDRSGSEPGDDEVVVIDLACLDAQHDDVNAVVVMGNIYEPAGLNWAKVDSAYARVISGGTTRQASGNFFVEGSEAVRSFIRLSGNDLKGDPNLRNNALAVGILFKQPEGNWAFSALLKGMEGKAAMNTVDNGQLQGLMQSLTYPASKAWDRTSEQQGQVQEGNFGEAGFFDKGREVDLIKQGQLPCIADRDDHAMLKLGKMDEAKLAKVAQSQSAKIPAGVRAKAQQMVENKDMHAQVKKLAEGYDALEKASTVAERKKIAEEQFGTIEKKTDNSDADGATKKADETDDALDELEDLFNDI